MSDRTGMQTYGPGCIPELTPESKVGQLLHIGIGLGVMEQEVTSWPNERMRRAIDTLEPGAVRVYGAHNDPYFMAEYTSTLQQWAADTGVGIPLLISSDAEYGPCDILRHGVTGYPLLMGLTAAGSPALAESVAATIAGQMRSCGLNVVQQPVADVNTNPNNPVIGVRAAGYDVEDVIEYTTANIRGVKSANQIAVAKHFPGHGDTEEDSHHDLPVVTYDRDTLEEIHLRPFKMAFNAGVDAVMTSHIVVECLDDKRPATLSKAVMTDLLRDEMGFDGVVVTDAMMMDAIADNYGIGEAAVEAINAGVDLVLTGYVPFEDLVEIRNALLDAVESGELPEARVDESVARILDLKERYSVRKRDINPIDALETTGRAEARELARRSYEASFVLLGSDDPFPVSDQAHVFVTGIKEVRTLETTLDDAVGDLVGYELPECDDRPTETTAENESGSTGTTDLEERIDFARSVAATADVSIVTTYTNSRFPDAQRTFVAALAEHGPVIVVSLGLPVEYDHLPDDVAYIATFAQNRLGNPSPLPDAACEALCTFVQSEQHAAGSLPFR